MGRLLGWYDETGVDSEALSAVGAVTQLLETDLGLHLRKEEEVLFPALAACLGQGGGPIGVMLMGSTKTSAGACRPSAPRSGPFKPIPGLLPLRKYVRSAMA